MKIKNLHKLIFVFFLFVLNGCDFFNNNTTTQTTQATTTQVVTTTQPTTTQTTITTTTAQTTTTAVVTTESELTIKLKEIYNLALAADAFDGTYEEWLETVRGPQGEPGEQVLLRVSSGFIQWKYESETTWHSLISLTELTGEDGREVTFQVSEGYIQWQYIGDDTWINLISLDVLTGADGVDGREVTFQVSDGYIQWQYTGDTSWTNLVELASLTGPAGQDGIDGKEVTFQVSDGYIQWKYVGETDWTNLVSLDTFAGEDGLGIKEMAVNEFGELIVTYTDDSEVNLGVIVAVFQVNFRDYNGYLLDAQDVNYGMTAITPENPTRTGYTFVGWNKEYNSETSNLTITALYEINKYDVTFESDGGSFVENMIDVPYGSSIDLPIPTKTGYYFAGWFYGQDINSDQFTSTDTIKDDTVLYARWSLQAFTVEFRDYDETLLYKQSVSYGFSAMPPHNPTREGYTFIGWSTNFIVVESDLIVYAKYVINTYNIDFDSDGGSEITPIFDVEYWTTLQLPIPTKLDYDFVGWYYNDMLFTDTEPITCDMLLVARWEPHQYVLSFDTGFNDYYVLAEQGGAFGVAVDNHNHVFTWGNNVDYQMGTIGYEFSTTPIDITEFIFLAEGDYFIQLETSRNSAALLTANGALFTWGSNNYGELGTLNDDPTCYPIRVDTLWNLHDGEQIVQVVMGYDHLLVLTSEGRVLACGNNASGQLGTGDQTATFVPVDITANFNLSENEEIIKLDAGAAHSLAITNQGRVFGWGHDQYSQVGDESTSYAKVLPVDVTLFIMLYDGETFIDVKAGYYHSMVLTSNGRLFTWGYNYYGELGIGNQTIVSTPIEVTNHFNLNTGEKIIAISASQTNSMALTSEGRVFGFGSNAYGQVSASAPNPCTSPYEISSAFFLMPDEEVLNISAGEMSVSILTNRGRLFTWGYNGQGQLADGTTINRSYPLAVTDPAIIIDNQYFQINTIVYDLPELEQPNYIFTGWYLNGVSITAPFEYDMHQDIVLTAGWISSIGDFTYEITPEGIYITSYLGSDSELILPDYILGIPVVGISEDAFRGNSTITYLKVGQFVEIIGNYAFAEMTNLQEIVFVNSTVNFGIYTLYSSNNLQKITLSCDFNYAFDILFGGTSANIPDSLEYLIFATGGQSISEILLNGSLPEITIVLPSDWTVVPQNLFAYNENISSVIIPEGITIIEANAFLNSTLVEVYIPSTLVETKDNVFMGSLLSNIVIAENSQWQIIGSQTFFGCASLRYFTIGASITLIDDLAFYMSGVEEILFEVSDNDLVIDRYAFAYTQLDYIVLPDRVSYVGNFCFSASSINVIFAEHLSQPTEWDINWNPERIDVFWGFLGISEYQDTIYAYSIDQAYIIGLGDGFAGHDIWIEQYLNGYEVVGIKKAAFANNLLLETAYFNTGITKIPDNLFYGCTNLILVGFADDSQIESIGDYAFYDTAISTFNLPSSVQKIGDYAFKSDNLEFFNVPDDSRLEYIGNHAFEDCNKLQYLFIPDTVSFIAGGAFFYNYSLSLLIESSTVPLTWEVGWNSTGHPEMAYYLGVTEIGEIDGLTYAVLEDSAVIIVCESKDNENPDLVVPETINGLPVTTIAGKAFDGHPWLNSITFSTSIVNLDYQCIANNGDFIIYSDLQGYNALWPDESYWNPDHYPINYYIPIGTIVFETYGGTQIPDYVNEAGLEAIAPADPTKDGYIFDGWYADEAFTIPYIFDTLAEGTSYAYAKWIEDVDFTFTLKTDDTYEVTGYIGDLTDIIIPSTYNGLPVTSIGDSAFMYNTSITSIVIPSSVTSINNKAFYGCNNLVNVTLSEGLLHIGEYVFQDCFILVNIDIPSTVLSIGMQAFTNCSSLTEITIPEGITVLNHSLFANCTNLESIVLPDSLITISMYVFANCPSLETIIIRSSVTTIMYGAFNACYNLIIYAEAESKPVGFDDNWNRDNAFVVWGFSGESYTYTFEENGGTEVNPINTAYAIEEPVISREGYELVGWYPFPEFAGDPITFPYYRTSDVILYAKWEFISEPGTTVESAINAIEDEANELVFTNGENQYVWYKFIPSQTATYYIYSTGDIDVGATLYNSMLDGLQTNDDFGSDVNYLIQYDLLAGEPYYLRTNYGDGLIIGEYTIYFSTQAPSFLEGTSYDLAIESTLNQEYMATYNGGNIFFKFTPVESGTYFFYSTGSLDTGGCLYNSNSNELALNWDSTSGDNENFFFEYNLEAGHTYYIVVNVTTALVTAEFGFNITDHAPSYAAGTSFATAIGVGINEEHPISYNDQNVYFKYTSPITATYYVYTTGDLDTYGEIYNSNYDTLDWNYDSGENTNFLMAYTLEEGETYYFVVTVLDGVMVGDISFYVATEYPDFTDGSSYPFAFPAIENIEYNVPDIGDYVYYEFVPTNTATYYIYSIGEADTYAEFYNSDYEMIGYDFDAGSNLNFLIELELTQGQTYYLVTYWEGDTAHTDYSIIFSTSGINETGTYFDTSILVDMSEFTVSIEEVNQTLYYQFTPSVSSYYNISSYGEYITYGAIYLDTGSGYLQLAENIGNENWNNFYIYIELEAGVTYYIVTYMADIAEVGNYSIDFDDYSCYFGSTLDFAIPLEEDVPRTINTYTWPDLFLSFTPMVSGNYRFYSTGEYDTYALLLGDIILAENDNSGEDNNFSITAYLEAGVTYYLCVEMAVYGEMGEFDVYVTSVVVSEPGDSCFTAIPIDITQAQNLYMSDLQMTYYVFTAQETGTYYIYTNGSNDTYAALYNVNEELLIINDDLGNDLNFLIEFDLQAGETYYIGLYTYSDAASEIVSFSTYNPELDYTFELLGNSTYAITGYVGLDQEITLPTTYMGLPVTEVADNAFTSNFVVHTVVIPEGYVSIGGFAFNTAYNLEHLVIPSTMEFVGYLAIDEVEADMIIYLASGIDTSAWDINWNPDNHLIINDYTGVETTYIFYEIDGTFIDEITTAYAIDYYELDRIGYHLLGWYDDVSLTGDIVTFPYYQTAETIVRFYAGWAEINLGVGSSFSSSIQIFLDEENTVTVPSAGEYAFYQFTPSISGMYRISSSGTEDTVGYLFSFDEIQMLFNDDGGVDFNFEYDYYLEAGVTYYIVTGLYSSTNTDPFTILVTMIEETTYIFETNGGTAIDDITTCDSIAEPEVYRDGYTLVGWYLNADFTGDRVDFPYINSELESVTLYAKWIDNTEIIGSSFETAVPLVLNNETFVPILINGQTVYFTFTPAYTTSFTLTSFGGFDTIGYLYDHDYDLMVYDDDSGDGFNFLMTYTLEGGMTYYLEVGMLNGDDLGTFSIMWSELGATTYIFEENGGTPVEDITTDGSVEEPLITRPGYTFEGWYLNADFSGFAVTFPYSDPVLETVTFYAKWEPIEYTLTSIVTESDTYIGEYLLAPNDYIIQIEVGWNHNVILTSDGRVFTVGLNGQGELGTGDFVDSEFYVEITANFNLLEGEKVVVISANAEHNLALTNLNRLFVWGSDESGKLGMGTNNVHLNVPTLNTNFTLAEGEFIEKIYTGCWSSYVLTSTGRVFSWGDNSGYQLGTGISGDKYSPTDITGNFLFNPEEQIIALYPGAWHVFAITNQNNVFLWGANHEGQLGIGSTTWVSTPVMLINYFTLEYGEYFVSFSGGAYHSVGLTNLGNIYTTGRNDEGQLGLGDFTDRLTFTYVPANDSTFVGSVALISTGYVHTMVMTSAGRIYTFGDNGNGQLGDGSTTDSPYPIDITGSFDINLGEWILSIDACVSDSAILTNLGTLYVWGDNQFGQIGNNTHDNQVYPLLIVDETDESEFVESHYFDDALNIQNPVLDGYTFIGWYLDVEYTIPFDLEFMPASDITIYAKFEITEIVGGSSFETATEVNLNEEIPILIEQPTQEVYLMFVPDETATYYIYSVGDYDTYGRIYGSDQVSITGNDSSGLDENFLIEIELIAGETYYIKTNLYWDDQTGNFSVFISLFDPIVLYEFELLENNTYAITGYLGDASNITLPTTYLGLPVTEIGDFAFSEQWYIQSIVIPEGYISIGDYAFYETPSLDKLFIPTTMEFIGSGAVYDCGNLIIYASMEFYFWGLDWNQPNYPVIWGYTATETEYIFEENGGEEAWDCITVYAITQPNITKENYTLIGWYLNADFSGDPVTFPFISDEVSVTLYAKWEENESYPGGYFTSALSINEGEDTNVIVSNPDETVYYVFSPTVSGTYRITGMDEFDTYGWLYGEDYTLLAEDDDSGIGMNFLITYDMVAGQTYYIRTGFWSSSETGTYGIMVDIQTETSYVFEENGGTAVDDITTTASIYQPEISREGYILDGWYLSADFTGDIVEFPYYSSEETVTLYAKWSPVSYIEEGSSILNPIILELDMTETVVLDEDGETKYYSFTPIESGAYEFYSLGSYNTYGILYDQDITPLSLDDDGGVDGNFSIVYQLVGGQTYYLATYLNIAGETGSYSLIVTTSDAIIDPGFDSATSLGMEDQVTVNITVEGEMVYYILTPEYTGTYIFQSYGDYDTYVTLYDDTYLELANDDDAGTGYNFKLTYVFSAGEVYYLKVQMLDSTELGTFTLQSSQPSTEAGSSFETAITIQLNIIVSAVIDENGEILYYEFTPLTSGTYMIYSYGYYDTVGALYDGDYGLLTYDDDSGDGRNFIMFQTLYEGEIYYISVEMYETTDLGTFEIIISESSDIDEFVFSLLDDNTYAIVGYSGSTETVEIPESYMGLPVTVIDVYAFVYNDIITEVSIPETIIAIYDGAFMYCTSLTAINIPASVEYVGWYTFYGSSQLTIFIDNNADTSLWDGEWNPDGLTVMYY